MGLLEVIDMKIAFYNRLNRLWLQKIEELRDEFNHLDFVTDPEQAKSALESAHALVTGRIPLELIGRAQRLEMIFVPVLWGCALEVFYRSTVGTLCHQRSLKPSRNCRFSCLFPTA